VIGIIIPSHHEGERAFPFNRLLIVHVWGWAKQDETLNKEVPLL
jgi:hypothetical protein